MGQEYQNAIIANSETVFANSESGRRANTAFVWLIGNSQGGTEFRDKMDDAEADGGLLVQYNAMMSFLKRNLRNVQVDPDFNSLGQLEIPIGALSEICSNALLCKGLHNSAYVKS